MKRFIHKHLTEKILLIIFLTISTFLMIRTFSYGDHTIYIASKAWSDFSATIPLIRSFSYGTNFPPEYPLFSGAPIRYHFLFYLLVGILEKFGARIDVALNSLSIIGFTSFLFFLYLLGKNIFHSKAVGILSVIFVLFNGSLGFIYYFQSHPLSVDTLSGIITNTTFSAFGPYDNKLVTAFWNLNIYTNQRHLAVAYAGALALILLLLKALKHKNILTYKRSVLIGIILGSSFFFHLSVLICLISFLASLFLLFKSVRKPLFVLLLITGIIVLPQYLYLRTGNTADTFLFRPGYLVANSLSIWSFIQFWVANLGLHIIFIPLGFFFASSHQKKFFICCVPIFIIGNLFQFSPDIATNHKFFNFFMLFGSILSAYALVILWQSHKLFRPLVIISTFFLILSGLIDFFPIANDYKLGLPDYQKNPDITWIKDHTETSSVFLTTQYQYDSASLAGRKIFLGWPYFAWSAGYKTKERNDEIKSFFSHNDPKEICHFLTLHNIIYITLTTPSEDFPYDKRYWETNFSPIYINKSTPLSIYSSKEICTRL